jgi:hypothetical protein
MISARVVILQAKGKAAKDLSYFVLYHYYFSLTSQLSKLLRLLLGFLPFLMIDTKSLISNALPGLAMEANGVPGENLCHQSTLSRVIYTDRVAPDCWIELDVLVSKGIDAHSDNNRCCRAHDNNDWVCGGITEPCLFEVVVVHFLCSENSGD